MVNNHDDRCCPLRIGLFPFQMAVSWLINGDDPIYLLNGMILQVDGVSRFFFGEISNLLRLVSWFYYLHVFEVGVPVSLPHHLQSLINFWYIPRWLFGNLPFITGQNFLNNSPNQKWFGAWFSGGFPDLGFICPDIFTYMKTMQQKSSLHADETTVGLMDCMGLTKNSFFAKAMKITWVEIYNVNHVMETHKVENLLTSQILNESGWRV